MQKKEPNEWNEKHRLLSIKSMAMLEDIRMCKQTLTNTYSLTDLRSLGILKKSEFNTAKSAQFTLF